MGLIDLKTGMLKSAILRRLPSRSLGIPEVKLDKRYIFPKPGSRSEAILADLKDGRLSRSEIAKKHKCSRPNITNVYRRALERGIFPEVAAEWTVAFGVTDSKAIIELRREALARGRNPKDLVRQIIRRVSLDDLFAAILDR